MSNLYLSSCVEVTDKTRRQKFALHNTWQPHMHSLATKEMWLLVIDFQVGILAEKFSRVRGKLPETLTLFVTKICNFLHPINNEQTKDLITFLNLWKCEAYKHASCWYANVQMCHSLTHSGVDTVRY